MASTILVVQKLYKKHGRENIEIKEKLNDNLR